MIVISLIGKCLSSYKDGGENDEELSIILNMREQSAMSRYIKIYDLPSNLVGEAKEILSNHLYKITPSEHKPLLEVKGEGDLDILWSLLILRNDLQHEIPIDLYLMLERIESKVADKIY